MIANWIKEARQEAGLSGEALGTKLAFELGTARGHTKANISHWETEKHSPSLQQLLAIAKVTGRSLPAAIIDGLRGSDPAALFPGAMRVVVSDASDDTFIQVPMVKLRLSAGVTGFQTEPEQHDGGTVGMRRDWVERKGLNPGKLIAILVKGQSMEPTLYEDDIVVINTADRKPAAGQVFAVNFNGEPVVKRMQKDGGRWWLASDNPDQRTYYRRACEGDGCLVIGRVVRKESDRI
ncbi:MULTISPECIES: XRE family transcriptional regulator [unclassified Massilia]|uniref:XRE family transcriptional regulator n=1 Tax=unclassified Massilia TaxID=2609279 RepID=UPI00177BBFE7|nr:MULTISPECIES: XRE family transcriptional regulator [unclassified Massilia]MBD8532990.1 LexA family transcriptional regulator [Massilia sp. CFBP 13647]MBD8676357.1 LexA family transcriptional regulator [Massilia sp. CFBP 13721]